MNTEGNLVRLQKYIADCGVTSRRKAEELIEEGRVEVNQEIITELGTKVDPNQDVVMVDGSVIDIASIDKIYMVMHKPRGYVTTTHDPEGRQTVMDLTKGINARLFPVGRLDYLSEGLLIMTNDGDLTNKIIHPRYGVEKVYEVKVFGAINEYLLKKLRMGIRDNGELLKPKSVRVVKQLPKKTWIEFRLTEGKNREIRRLCEACDLTIDKLKRVAIEGLSIQGIAPGEFRLYSKHELEIALNMKGGGKKGSKKSKSKRQYHSNKKSVKVKSNRSKRRQKDSALASDETFHKYRKPNYNQTMKYRKEAEAKAKERAAKELDDDSIGNRITDKVLH